jgi:type IV secretion system protein TrbJ
MKRRRHLLAVSALAIAIACTASPTSSQLIVFDPNNYAQNVLTAARELQQINNQIISLQNQAQMLINQTKNLASLPYSSLQQLEQSIQRTQQLLAQAQRIAYDIKQIDRAFSTTYAPASTNASDQVLIANAQTRWQNSVAGLQDALRVQATVVGNLDTHRKEMSALVSSSQGATGALQASQAGISSLACRPSNSPTLQQLLPRRDGRKISKLPSVPPPRTRAGSSFVAFSHPGAAINLQACRCFTNERA